MLPAITVDNCRWIQIESIRDGYDGIICVAQQLIEIPFDIKRVYFIYNLIKHEQVCRGKHAHKTLQQVLFCIHGSCTVSLDDGANQQDIELIAPNTGIYLGTRLWHTMFNFTNNCILLVFASDFYSELDYIRNYDEFLRCRFLSA
ncbi:MAG: FdtA/QdtA family cupin domain-containing protein [Chitinivibrionales bacterium]|nr:FdtA/QdtA family cupin domain-containing protein [Chitinivibrionales bacterium]